MDGLTLTLPQDPWFWGVVVVCVTAVVLYARHKGIVIFKYGGKELVLGENAPGEGRAINVVNRSELEGEFGEVVGHRGTDAGQDRPVNVANDAIIKGKVDRIVGHESSSRRSGEDPGSGS